MSADRFARIGNNLSADFANTVVSFERDGGSLHGVDDVIDFLRATDVLSAEDESAARALAKTGPAAFVELALRLRAAVTQALVAIESSSPIAEDARALLNDVLRADAAYERLDAEAGSYALVRTRLHDEPAALLAPIARDTARLLSTPGVPVRHCAGVGCVRHFYDDSRTRKRRWCEMAICGNRAKVAAFSARRAGPTGG
jgi:predicted RNA-binding Zn ribbon-like protein